MRSLGVGEHRGAEGMEQQSGWRNGRVPCRASPYLGKGRAPTAHSQAGEGTLAWIAQEWVICVQGSVLGPKAFQSMSSLSLGFPSPEDGVWYRRELTPGGGLRLVLADLTWCRQTPIHCYSTAFSYQLDA